MPSPFPGMDPYLESPDWFPNLHDALITFTVGAALSGLAGGVLERHGVGVLAEVFDLHLDGAAAEDFIRHEAVDLGAASVSDGGGDPTGL